MQRGEDKTKKELPNFCTIPHSYQNDNVYDEKFVNTILIPKLSSRAGCIRQDVHTTSPVGGCTTVQAASAGASYGLLLPMHPAFLFPRLSPERTPTKNADTSDNLAAHRI